MLKLNLFTKEEIEKYGFIYEPDPTKCKAYKLRLGIPAVIDEDFKKVVADEIMFIYVNEITETENLYEGDPNFLVDSKVIVRGHTQKNQI